MTRRFEFVRDVALHAGVEPLYAMQPTQLSDIIDQTTRYISSQHYEVLERFAAAYFKMTDIPPQDAVLVRQVVTTSDGLVQYRYWFESKQKDNVAVDN